MAFNKGKGSYGGGASRSFGRDRDDRGSGRSFGGGGGGGGRSFGGGGRPGGQLELFDVTCAQCGTHTQVPFKPTGERPVLCRECFKGGDGARDNQRSAPRGNAGADNSRELREINEKLDKIMNALDIE